MSEERTRWEVFLAREGKENFLREEIQGGNRLATASVAECSRCGSGRNIYKWATPILEYSGLSPNRSLPTKWPWEIVP